MTIDAKKVSGTFLSLKKVPDTLRQATLCFPVRGNEVLLAMKKRGFGVNRWNGAGGKLKDNETIEEAMVRETEEEIMVTPTNYHQVAQLDFYFAEKPEWNQKVFVYFASAWRGTPTETEEMAPQWFNQKTLPLDKMWSDDQYWLPRVLAGEKLEAEFLFGENDILLDHLVRGR
jgi:mutator protein MutT